MTKHSAIDKAILSIGGGFLFARELTPYCLNRLRTMRLAYITIRQINGVHERIVILTGKGMSRAFELGYQGVEMP